MRIEPNATVYEVIEGVELECVEVCPWHLPEEPVSGDHVRLLGWSGSKPYGVGTRD